MKFVLAIYAVIAAAMVFAALQLHIAAAQMHLLAEERYQHTLHDVCPKQPNLSQCKDMDRIGWSDQFERWIVQFAVR